MKFGDETREMWGENKWFINLLEVLQTDATREMLKQVIRYFRFQQETNRIAPLCFGEVLPGLVVTL